MRSSLAAFIIVLAAAASAPAMNATAQGHCRVVGGAKLPASANAEAICAAIERAVTERAPNVRFSAEVKVVKPSMLATSLVVNGKTLPEQKFAVMDRELGAASIKRFAESIAMEVAKAAKA